MIQSAGFNFNSYFVGLDGWVGSVGVLKYLRSAMLIEDDSFHKELAADERR
jgi:hypothetical protein